MPFWLAVVAATAGNLVGSLIAYAVGRAGSNRDLGPRTTKALARCNRLFARYGVRAVFLARLMPLARTFISLPAGYSRVALGPFTALTVAGCAIWAAAFALLGVIAGAGWAELSGTVSTVLLALTALALATWLLLQRREPTPSVRGERSVTVLHPGLLEVVSFDTHSLSAGPDLPHGVRNVSGLDS